VDILFVVVQVILEPALGWLLDRVHRLW